ncbi:MAG: hypothetical protein EOO43_23300 [Flavobacterium sp.]|nr:MAG: hypothetical protein EOO43_23300 [Flavobacterium sp.]
MFYLPLPTVKELDDYHSLIEKSIQDALDLVILNVDVKAYLTKERIKQIIVDPPDKLLGYHNDVMNLLINGFESAEFKTFRHVRKKKNKTPEDDLLIARYRIAEQLEKVFNYGKFISGSKSFSYDFAIQLGQQTCTYCNRIYAQTIIAKNKSTGTIDDTGRITRPDFDHWYPKSKYPVLALSYFNLIPSCGICNSSIKGDADFNLATHVHPYVHEPGQDFNFSYDLKDAYRNNVKIKCVKNSKIDNTLKAFKIEEVYNAHSDLELKDLLDMRYKYSENYLDTLLNRTFKSLDISNQEAYRLAFGVEEEKKNYHKRAFSKFKIDILRELGISIS